MASEHLIGANIAPLAAFSMNTPQASYPATNGNNKRPWDPMKSTGTGCVITITFGGAKTLQGFGIHMHNLVGATVTLAHGGGFSQVVAIPARTARGRCVDAWLDMRLMTNTSATVWTLTVSGAAANVSIGELSMVSTLSDAPFLVDGPVEFGERELVEVITGTYGTKHTFEYGTRIRFARGRLIEETDRAAFYAVWQAAGGMIDPFLFIPDVDVNDAWLAQFENETLQWGRSAPDHSPMTVGITEVSGGLVP